MEQGWCQLSGGPCRVISWVWQDRVSAPGTMGGEGCQARTYHRVRSSCGISSVVLWAAPDLRVCVWGGTLAGSHPQFFSNVPTSRPVLLGEPGSELDVVQGSPFWVLSREMGSEAVWYITGPLSQAQFVFSTPLSSSKLGR